MKYVVVQSDTLVELEKKVNGYWQLGWEPLGGVNCIRERISGPVFYIQAVGNFDKNGNATVDNKWKRKHG